MIETITLKFLKYRDNDEKPTCAIDFAKGHFCQFHGTQSFGTKELCLFHEKQILERRNHGRGTLIPVKNCPLWEDS
jgi:hypothetical protein